MIWLRLAGEVTNWSSWLWQNRGEFDSVIRGISDVGDFAAKAISDPNGALRRQGNTLIFGQPDGGQQILAFVEQTGPRIEAIEHAVDGLQAGQAAVSASLSGLQQLSMVTLGLSALTPLVLMAQFLALNRKLNTFQQEFARFHKKFDASIASELRAGLDLIRQGHDLLESDDRLSARNRLEAALPLCITRMKYYAELLGNELSQKKVSIPEIRMLGRYLSVSVLAVASSQIGLEQDQHAFAQSSQELDLLRQATKTVFRETVIRDLPGLMMPMMRVHGVTIELIAGLYRQAQDAGAVDPSVDCNVPGWFEAHRDTIVRSGSSGWWGWKPQKLLASLSTASAAVEETNRVLGLSSMVQHFREAGRSTVEIMKEFRTNVPSQTTDTPPYAVWGLGESR